jgi:hypothetical protein
MPGNPTYTAKDVCALPGGGPEPLVGAGRAIETLRKTFLPWLKLDPDIEIPNPGLILLTILCLALLLRIVAGATMSAIELDGTIYARMGEAFSRGAFRTGLREVFPPFYPLLIGLAHLVIPDLELAGRIVSLIAGLLLIYLSFRFVRSLAGESVALWAAFFAAIHPYLVNFSVSVLSESVAATLALATAFAFYRGITDNSGKNIVLSGFCLSLTYLTRPEYVVYLIPLFALLLARKRFFHACLFILWFAALAAAYIYIMKLETGLLVLSKKAILARAQDTTGTFYHSTLLPMVSMGLAFRYFPTVLFDVVNSILPQFVFLAVIGINRIVKPYKLLAALLILFHMLPMTAMLASSKRLYVELFPLVLPFTAAGLFSFKLFMERFRPGRKVYYAFLVIIVAITLAHGISLPDKGRGFNKQAGLFLKAHDPHRIVASRLPLIPFYGKGEFRYLPALATGDQTCPQFIEHLRGAGVSYAAVDEKVEKENPFAAECLKPLTPIASFGSSEEFVKLYSLAATGG